MTSNVALSKHNFDVLKTVMTPEVNIFLSNHSDTNIFQEFIIYICNAFWIAHLKLRISVSTVYLSLYETSNSPHYAMENSLSYCSNKKLMRVLKFLQ